MPTIILLLCLEDRVILFDFSRVFSVDSTVIVNCHLLIATMVFLLFVIVTQLHDVSIV